mgnify:FL=1
MADTDQITETWNRRKFLLRSTGASAGLVIGMAIPFAKNMPGGFVPMALAQEPSEIAGKDMLTLLNSRPLNAETAPHLLDDEVTPTNRHFIRNNGNPPEDMNPDTWTLTIDGLVDNALSLSIEDLKRDFEVVSYDLLVECGGNGRAFFDPPARGNQWTHGAVACSNWTGVRLADVLKAAGVKSNVIYTAHEGRDTHLSGDPEKHPVSRGMPIDKAMDPYNLIAFEQNGEALHPMNGAPLRLVVPGWPGSCSQKWLSRIYLRDQIHDGAKMTGTSYRVPGYKVAPGEKVPTEAFEIIEAMPVKSLITYPESMSDIPSDSFQVRGHAWAGDKTISQVDVSYDFGATWQSATLNDPSNTHAWQRWSADIILPEKGYYEIWAKATDSDGVSQPFAIDWNPKGYLNNSLHKIAIKRV